MASKNQNQYWEGVGRRKSASARVRIYENEMPLTVNGEPLDKHFPQESDQRYISYPLRVANLADLTYTIQVKGGGKSGWKDAIRLGLARALIKYKESTRPLLKEKGLLTRDARIKERKKPGLKKARKKPRFSKR